MVTRRSTVMMGVTAAAVLLPLGALHPAARAQAVPKKTGPNVRMNKANAAVSAVHAVPGEMDAQGLLAQGRALSPAAVAGLEQGLATAPDDLATHIELLGYYNMAQFHSVAARKKYDGQIYWMIQHHPESVVMGQGYALILRRQDPDAFGTGEALWLAQVSKQPASTTILGNAAEYCLLSDVPTAERLLKQAAVADPKSPQWPDKLGELYQLQVRLQAPEAVRRPWAQKALAEYETAMARDGAQASVNGDFEKTAVAAYDAGEYDKARRYATDLLTDGGSPGDYDPGGDVHHADMVLGLLALRDNDLPLAVQYLQAMGRVAGSPSLDAFGPNMRLAQALLERGDRQSVLDYFAECARFWKDDNGQLKAWTAQVQQGKAPDFSANLYY